MSVDTLQPTFLKFSEFTYTDPMHPGNNKEFLNQFFYQKPLEMKTNIT